MEKNLYAIKDKKAKNYDGFMILENDAQAVRAFAQACEKNEVFNKWPEDFELVKMGTIYQKTGIINAEKKPVFLAAGLSFVEKKKDEENPE